MKIRNTIARVATISLGLAGAFETDALPQRSQREPTQTETCATLDACVRQLYVVAGKHEKCSCSGIGQQEQRIAERLRTMPGVADAMVPLLQSRNAALADLAAYVLASVETIDPGHLPAIKAGLDRDLGWLAPALARIGTDEAAEEAVKRLSAKSDAANQEGYAVTLFGRRAVPFIVAAARCTGGCSAPELHDALGEALHDMGDAGATAVPQLLTILEDPATPQQVALGVLRMISRIGVRAKPWARQVEDYGKIHSAIAGDIEATLIKIHADSAASLLVKRLQSSNDFGTLYEIAELGKDGREAQNAVMEMLDDDDHDRRAVAARILGFIGDERAVEALVRALEDPTDVRLNLEAAKALGRLRATSAASALARTSNSHWHPRVRDAAGKSLRELGAQPNDAIPARDAIVFDQDPPGIDCEDPAVDIAIATKRLSGRRDASRLKRLQYAYTSISYGEPNDVVAASRDEIVVANGTMTRHERRMQQIPTVAMRVAGGWLAGADRGEWGGELMWLGDDGQRQQVYEGNVADLHMLGERIVAVAGVDRMVMNTGALFDIVRDGNGHWKAIPWRVLPGAPKTSGTTRNGELFVNTEGGGAVLMDARGHMRMADCRNPHARSVR